MADIDRARLRALAEKARDAEAAYLALPNTAPADDVLRLGRARNNASHALEYAASPEAILALLDALDAVARERDEARAQRDQTAREFDAAWGAALKANTERDALAALLREAYRLLDTASDATQTFPMVSIGHWMDKVNDALDARKGDA